MAKHRGTPLRPEILAKRREADVSRWLAMLAREGGHEATLVHADGLMEFGGSAMVRAAYGLEIAAHEAVVRDTGAFHSKWGSRRGWVFPPAHLAKTVLKRAIHHNALLPAWTRALYNARMLPGQGVQFDTFISPRRGLRKRHWRLTNGVRLDNNHLVPAAGGGRHVDLYSLSWEDD